MDKAPGPGLPPGGAEGEPWPVRSSSRNSPSAQLGPSWWGGDLGAVWDGGPGPRARGRSAGGWPQAAQAAGSSWLGSVLPAARCPGVGSAAHPSSLSAGL